MRRLKRCYVVQQTSKRTMKIGIVVDNEFNNDPRVVNEALILTEAGHQVFVLCYDFGGDFSSRKVPEVDITRIKIDKKKVNRMYGFYHVWSKFKIFWSVHIQQFIDANKLDVLHVNDLYMIESAKMGNEQNIPMVLDLHENYPTAIMLYNWANKFPNRILVQPRKWKEKEGKLLSYASKIIVLSEHYKQLLCKQYSHLNEDNFTVYPNVPNKNEFDHYPQSNKVIPKKENAFYMLYFGAIAERRGVFTCFEALKKLIKKYNNIHFVLIGPIDKADKQRVNQYLEDSDIKDNIIYKPWEPLSNLPGIVNSVDVCLSPFVKNDQHESGIANKNFQYMLFGKPLVVSNCIPQKQLIEENNCGLVFESENDEDLADKIMRLYQEEELRIQLGENAKKAALTKYNTEYFKNELIQLYSSFS